jgi:hypothetical protein
MYQNNIFLQIGLLLFINKNIQFVSCDPPCKWVNGKRICPDEVSMPMTQKGSSQNWRNHQLPSPQQQQQQQQRAPIKGTWSQKKQTVQLNSNKPTRASEPNNNQSPKPPPASHPTNNNIDCSKVEQQLQSDLEVALAASRSDSEVAVTTIHLVYIHIHGHLDHYYHFLHDALLTFYPLYSSFLDQGLNPTISKVVLWNSISYGSAFTKIFEYIYGVKIIEVPCKCPKGACAEITTDMSPVGSMSLDSQGVLDGLYPFYFDDAIKFVQQKALGNVYGRVSSAEQQQQQQVPPPPLSSSLAAPIQMKQQQLLQLQRMKQKMKARPIFGVGKIVLIERRSLKPSNNYNHTLSSMSGNLNAQGNHQIWFKSSQRTNKMSNTKRPSHQTSSSSSSSEKKDEEKETVEEGGWVGGRRTTSTSQMKNRTHIPKNNNSNNNDNNNDRGNRINKTSRYKKNGNWRKLLSNQQEIFGSSVHQDDYNIPGHSAAATTTVDEEEDMLRENTALSRNVGIFNHNELKEALVLKFGEDRVVNVMLEDLTFIEQVNE